MKYRHCMIAYNNGGPIVVGPHPDKTGWSDGYRFSVGSCFLAIEGIVAAGRRPKACRNAKERITSRSIVKTGVAAEKRVAAARHIASPGIRSEEGVVKARRITPASKTAEERIETLGVDWTRPETHKSAFVRIVRAQNPLTAEIVLCLRIDDVCRECAADS